MDDLARLPVGSSQATADEKSIMASHFGDPPVKTFTWGSAVKAGIVVTVVFVALANPWCDGLFVKVPYCGEKPLAVFALKALLFLVACILTIKLVA